MRWRSGTGLVFVLLCVAAGCTAEEPDERGWPRPPAPPDGARVFTVALPAELEEPERATLAGDIVVVAGEEDVVVGLDAGTGEPRWRLDDVGSPHVAGDALVDTEPDDAIATVFDLATGQERFRVDRLTFVDVAVTAESLLMLDCGVPCRLSAHSLRDGATLWETPLELAPGGAGPDADDENEFVAMPVRSARIAPANTGRADDRAESLQAPPAGLVAVRGGPAYADGGSTVPAITVDTRTGAIVTRWRTENLGEFSGNRHQLGDLLVELTFSADGDDGDVFGYDLRAGQLLWRRPLDEFTFRAGEAAANRYEPGLAGTDTGAVILTEPALNRVGLVDLRSARPRWESGTDLSVLSAAGDTAVAWNRDPLTDDVPFELVGFDVTTGDRRWAWPSPGPDCGVYRITPGGWALVGDRLVYGADVRCGNPFTAEDVPYLRVHDLATGELRWGLDRAELLGAGDDWVVASQGDEDARMALLFRS